MFLIQCTEFGSPPLAILDNFKWKKDYFSFPCYSVNPYNERMVGNTEMFVLMKISLKTGAPFFISLKMKRFILATLK